MSMSLEKLQTFVDAVDAELNDKYKIDRISEKAYARMTKVTEEVGEMANAVGCCLGFQRAEKMANKSNLELGMEMADVILTTFLLAKVMDVNVEDALKQKMRKIMGRSSGEYFKDIEI